MNTLILYFEHTYIIGRNFELKKTIMDLQSFISQNYINMSPLVTESHEPQTS
jgi:hypothetical protein